MSIYLVDENTVFEEQVHFCEVCGGMPKFDPDQEGCGYCPTCQDNSAFVSQERYEELHPDEFRWEAIASAVAEVVK